MSSSLVVVIVTAGLIAIALVTIFVVAPRLRAGGKEKLSEPVRGELTVVAVSQAPHDASYSNYELHGVVSGSGIQPTPVTKKGLAAVAKWPIPGRALPIAFEARNPSIFNIVWDEVLAGSQLGVQASVRLAQQMAQGEVSPRLQDLIDLAGASGIDLAGASGAGTTTIMVNGQVVETSTTSGHAPGDPFPGAGIFTSGASILTSGASGTGSVVSVQQIGAESGTLGTFQITLMVTPEQPGIAPFQGGITISFRSESARRRDYVCRVGAELPVRFDPANPLLLSLDPYRFPEGM